MGDSSRGFVFRYSVVSPVTASEELAHLRRAQGAHVVGVFAGFWDEPSGGTPGGVLLMELGTISMQHFCHQHGRLDLRMARRFALELCTGVGFLHERCILHRDLAPKNVLLCPDGADFTLKICDLGACIRIRPSIASRSREHPSVKPLAERLCTVPYASPEMLAGLPVGPPTDVWSAAIITWEWFSDDPCQIIGPDVALDPGNVMTPQCAKAAWKILRGLAFESMPLQEGAGGTRAALLAVLTSAREDPELRPGALALRGALENSATGAPAPGEDPTRESCPNHSQS